VCFVYCEEDDRSVSPKTMYLMFNVTEDVVKLTVKYVEGVIVLKLLNVIVE